MGWPIYKLIPADEFRQINRLAADTQAAVKNVRDGSLVADIPRIRLIHVMAQLDKAITAWNQAKTIPGMVAYARAQFDDAGMDVTAEFTAMVNAATALRDWINANFPKDANGAWLVVSYDATGAQSQLTFSSAQLAGFRAEADVFLATIDATG